MLIGIAILATIGLCISFYALFLETKIKKDATYKPVCDLSDAMSCTKPILSKYGKIFGFSNALFGVGFYFIVLILSLLEQIHLLFYLSIISCIATLYFAYILYTKIKTFCLVCTAIYAINFGLLIISYTYL